MAVTRLDDQTSDLLADYRNVPDPELVAGRGLFVAEGRLVVTRLLASDRFVVRSVLLTETAYASVRRSIDARPDVPVYLVSQDIMNAITGFNIHRGCLALGQRPPAHDWRQLAAASRTLLVLERVGDADNIGSLFRNAVALGADAVLLGPGCADPLYRKAIRTSMAAALTMPFAPVADWPQALHELRAVGWSTIALTPDPSATVVYDIGTARRGRRCAVVVGHEGDGLAAASLALCEHRVRIPMAAGTDSLNVATAAAIALYEIGRRGGEGA
jgi:tRNA G18 (ribose-2'-O)-methylase SpoU